MVGWKLEQRMDAYLVIEALNRALGQRLVQPDQLLIHTDQGSQYRATDYRTLLQKRKILCSLSAKGCCWDNAVVESFFSTLKLELSLDDHREVLISPQQLQRDLAFWIEGSTTTASSDFQRSVTSARSTSSNSSSLPLH